MTTLGRTGLTVSNLCLGSMQFGWTADERSSFDVMDAFVAAGGNFIDTADIYSRWHPGAVALAWELTRPAIQSPIIGANTPDQLADLLPAGDLQLTSAEIAALDAVSAST